MSAKPSLKALAAAQPIRAEAAAPEVEDAAKSYRTAATRSDTRQLSGHFPADAVKAFRILAATNDMDVQELLAEAINMVFTRYGSPERVEITSGRRKRV